MSLGVDLVPHKVCSLDCVYCECGKTTKLTTDRMEYILYDNVTAELNHFIENNPAPDYITFSGSGEPTLNSRIGDVLEFIKKLKPDIPVAVLTNGTLFNDKQVRSEIMNADVVLPSLDAASQAVFEKINSPDHKLKIEEYIDGIVTFRNEYKGKIWLEVLIIPGYNDSESELALLKNAFARIKPDSIQVNTLDRPGTVENLRSATRAELERVVDFWDMDIVEIISAAPDRKNIKSYREDIETAILETIFRRPCTVDDLVKILGRHINEVNKYLDVLEAEGKIEHVRQERGVFYKVVKS
jgi:wyosine [tRNA(Phe)-imidazoG37] synthetase (radical SAM superfamily)